MTIEHWLREAAEKYGLSYDLLYAVAKAESNLDPNAQSHAGAMGVMQLMPKTAEWLGVKDPWNPRENIMGGAKYLKMMLDQQNGDIPLALAAYNAGPGNVAKYGGIPPFAETQAYVKKIMAMLADKYQPQATLPDSVKPRHDESVLIEAMKRMPYKHLPDDIFENNRNLWEVLMDSLKGLLIEFGIKAFEKWMNGEITDDEVKDWGAATHDFVAKYADEYLGEASSEVITNDVLQRLFGLFVEGFDEAEDADDA